MAFDARGTARNMVEQLGEEEARRRLQASTHPRDRMVLAALDGSGGGEPGAATRALRFLGQGATQAGVAMMRANPVYSAGPLSRIREDVEQRHGEMKREPEGALENVSYYAGRLAPEALMTGAAGVATKALGAGRLARAALSNIPSALTFGSSKEEALVPSDNPAVRIGAEYGANLLGEGVFAAGGRALRALRGGRGAVPSEAIGKSVEDLTSGLRGRTAPGAREILEEQVEKQKRALGVAQQAEINPDDYMNIDKLNLSDEGKDRMRGIARKVIVEEGRVPKEVIPNEQTKREAFGLSRKDVLTAEGQDLNRVEFLAAKNFISENDATVDALSRQLGDPGLPVNEQVRLNAEIDAINAETEALWSPYSKTHSEDGRRLQAHKIAAQNSNDPFAWYHRADKMLDGRPLTDEHRRTIRNFLEKGDKEGLVDYVTALRKPTPAEGLATVWKAILLANPLPHIGNFVGNTTMKTLETAKEFPGFIIDRAFGAVTGIETKARPGTGIGRSLVRAGRTLVERDEKLTSDFLKTMPFSKRGLRRPTLAGLRERAQGQYHEVPRLARAADPGLDKVDQHRNVRFNNAFLDAGVNVVFRLLGDADAVFSQAAAVQSLEQMARVEAKRGLGQGDTFAARLAHLRQNPTDEMVFQALADAEYSTFRDRTALGGFVMGGKRLAETHGGQPGRLAAEALAPFTQTPTSVALKVGIDYTPVGLTRAMRNITRLPDKETRRMYRLARRALAEQPDTYNADRRVQLKIVNAMARSITGSAGPIALGIYLASQADDIITGPLPENPGERDAFYREGKMPWSIKIDGQWRSMERVSPGGNLLMTGAGIYFALKDEGLTAEDKALQIASTTGRMLTEQPFLTGTQTAIDLVTDAETRKLSKFVGGYASSVIPSGIRAIARGVDPTIRESGGVLGSVQASIPFVSKGLPARIGGLGDEARRPGGIGSQLFDIFKSSPDRIDSDQLVAALHESGITIGGRDKLPDETPEEYEQRMRDEGAQIKEMLTMAQESGVLTPEYAPIIEREISNLRSSMTEDAKLRRAMRALGVSVP